MAAIKCSRCGQNKEAMERPPFKGALGSTIHANVCTDCWKEWQGMQTKIINEYRLSMGDPRSQEMLDGQMKTFLSLPEGP